MDSGFRRSLLPRCCSGCMFPHGTRLLILLSDPSLSRSRVLCLVHISDSQTSLWTPVSQVRPFLHKRVLCPPSVRSVHGPFKPSKPNCWSAVLLPIWYWFNIVSKQVISTLTVCGQGNKVGQASGWMVLGCLSRWECSALMVELRSDLVGVWIFSGWGASAFYPV